MNNILEVKNLDYFYQDGNNVRHILIDTNISFESGKFYTIIGESGSGKSTFLSLIAGLDKPKAGEILFKDQNIYDIGLVNYRRNLVSMIFQNYNLIEYMNAYDNIVTALDIAKLKIDKEKIISELEYFGIDKIKMKRKVSHLSGGERQRVAIARSIATNAELIIADEPTGNLDIETSNYIVATFKRLVKEFDKTIIMVTHNETIAKESDQIIRINQIEKKLEYVD